MVAMDDKALALLRQKLQALNYTGEGGPAAMRSRARRGRAFLGLGIPVASGGGGGGVSLPWGTICKARGWWHAEAFPRPSRLGPLCTGELTVESAPLIARLTEDLIHTTESYRTLKLGLAKQGQEAEQWQTKADALKRDAERVLQENNRLHMDMLNMTETLQKRERQEYEAQVRRAGAYCEALAPAGALRAAVSCASAAFWRSKPVGRYLYATRAC